MAIKLTGVNLGYMRLPKSLLINEDASADASFKCPALAYVIEHPDGRILWDTGIPAHANQEWSPELLAIVNLDDAGPESRLEQRLNQMRLGPDDFSYVIMSHLHTDHAGGLRLFRDAGATVIVHSDEYKHVAAMQDQSEILFNKADFAWLGGITPTLVSDEFTELAKDVSLIHLPGHTPGTMGLSVRLEHTGWVVLASDSLYLHKSYVEPISAPAVVWDGEYWKRSVEKLRRTTERLDAFIFPGHDDTGILQRKDRYEFRQIRFWPDYSYE